MIAKRAWIGPMTRNAAIQTATLSTRAVTTKIPIVTVVQRHEVHDVACVGDPSERFAQLQDGVA